MIFISVNNYSKQLLFKILGHFNNDVKHCCCANYIKGARGWFGTKDGRFLNKTDSRLLVIQQT